MQVIVQSSWPGAVHVQSSSPGFTHSANACGEAINKVATVNKSAMARIAAPCLIGRWDVVQLLCNH